METVGLLIFSSLFLFSGINHLRNHSAMVGYTLQSLGDCPIAPFLAPLGGAPTGLFLVFTGVAAAFSQVWAFYALAAFLAVVTGIFHRNLKDPANLKTVALLGAALALASVV